jgi:hypothetical protein
LCYTVTDIDYPELIELREKQEQHDKDSHYQRQREPVNNNGLLRQRHPGRELRKVQALQGERSLVFVLPKSMAVQLGIEKGDYLSVHVELPRKIILEKAEV